MMLAALVLVQINKKDFLVREEISGPDALKVRAKFSNGYPATFFCKL
jgi:hypothetical protein